MRIGLLTTSFPRFDGDVAGTFVLGFARALVARGHYVNVLAPQPRESERVHGGAVWHEGIELHHVPYVWPSYFARTFYGAGVMDNARDPRAWPGFMTFPLALTLGAQTRLRDCDALVSHFALPCGLVAGALRARRPHLAVLHSADLHLLERLPARRRIARALLAGATHVTCVSEAHRARLLALLPEGAAQRVSVQAMGIDAASFERLEPKASAPTRPLKLLTLARLVPVKGLLEALAMLGERSDLQWSIAGDGPLRSELEASAAGLQLDVRFLGEVRGAAKLRALHDADAFFLPSRVLASGRTEGAPHALLEAMAAGLPCIAAAVGGVPSLIDHGRTGLLFEPDDAASLHAALDSLMHDRARATQLALGGSERAKSHDWRPIAARLEAWLEPS
jgi:glycosyltransferase involved in cell wall biosynthesis